MNDDWVFDSEEMWSSKAIDDSEKAVGIVKSFLDKAIEKYPSEKELVDACISISVLKDDGWPEIQIDLWISLFEKYDQYADEKEIEFLKEFSKNYTFLRS